MKKIFLTIATIAFASLTVFSQDNAISRYFEKYMNDDRFSMVYISPKLFDMVSRVDLESDEIDPEVMKILEELKGLNILSYDGEEARKFYNEALGTIDMNQFETLVEARDGNENVKIMAQSEGDYVKELLLLVGGDNEFVLMSFVGNLDLKKVGKLGKMLNLNGTEHLEKVEYFCFVINYTRARQSN